MSQLKLGLCSSYGFSRLVHFFVLSLEALNRLMKDKIRDNMSFVIIML